MRDCVHCVLVRSSVCYLIYVHSMSKASDSCIIYPQGGDCGAHRSGEVIPDTGAVPYHRGSRGPYPYWWGGHCSTGPPWSPLQNYHHTTGQCLKDTKSCLPVKRLGWSGSLLLQTEAALIGDYSKEQIDNRYVLYMTPLQKTQTIPLTSEWKHCSPTPWSHDVMYRHTTFCPLLRTQCCFQALWGWTWIPLTATLMRIYGGLWSIPIWRTLLPPYPTNSAMSVVKEERTSGITALYTNMSPTKSFSSSSMYNYT